jgi:hypothetical protein
MSFDVAKWNKRRYLAEAGLLESTADLAANAINQAIDTVDKNLSYQDFALAVAKILKEEYGSQNFDPFMEVLHTKLGMGSLKEDLTQDLLDMNDTTLLSTYEDKLRTHDWYYMMSDDSRAYNRGDAEKGVLINIKKELEGRGLADEAKALLTKYEKRPF